MEEKISVIVPIYKVEKYLRKCVDSIINQTYKNLEIILVDDGSPDNCPAICDEYAKKDNRIKVIHKPNGGLSDARNAGLDIATGEYIAFVDSDDYIDLTMYEKLYNAIKQNNCDLAICGFRQVDENDKPLNNGWSKKFVIYEKDHSLDALFTTNIGGIVVAWNKLYKKHIFDIIRYPKGLIHEDEYIIYDVIVKCNGIVIIEDQLYNYVQRANSIIGSKPTKKVFDVITALEYRKSKIGLNDKYYPEVCSQLLNAYYTVWQRVQNGDKELKKEVFDRYKKEYKEYKKFLNIKRKIKHFLLRYFKITI